MHYVLCVCISNHFLLFYIYIMLLHFSSFLVHLPPFAITLVALAVSHIRAAIFTLTYHVYLHLRSL